MNYLNLPLFVTDISYGIFFVITVLFGIWVYLKSSRKTAHVMFLLMCLAVGVYQISHVFGITTADSEASRSIFTMGLSLIFVVCFAVHWIAAAVEREKEYRKSILLTYVVGTGLALLYLIFPSTYLALSSPKLYFPNYYEAGTYYWILVVFYAAAFAFIMKMLMKSYWVSDSVHRNRLAYYILAILIGFPLGSIAFFLTFNIDVDPIYSVLWNFFVVPLAYGVLQFDIMNIKVAARKTLSYAAFILGTALFILGANLGNSFLEVAYPFVPSWILPLVSSLFIVLVAGYIWERMLDLEMLKYEFITVVTHKFRTPLTRIKWSSEILRHHAKQDDDEKMAISEIENANEHLVALTDMLLNLRKASDSTFQYDFESVDACPVVKFAAENMLKRIKDKAIQYSLSCPDVPVFISIDRRRMFFALQIAIDNAVSYTPQGGHVSIILASDESNLYIKIKDSGIGIAKDDLSKVFAKFWRSKEAKTADTEGMGIGLFMAKEIIQRHDGEIYAESLGVGKGATFTIRLPLAARSE